MRWGAAALLIALLACRMLEPQAGGLPWGSPSMTAPLGADEFGRNLLLVVLAASGRSLALAAAMAVVTIAMALAIAMAIAAWRPARAMLLFLTQVVESVPILLWILVAFAAFGGDNLVVAAIGFIVAVLPFAATILSGEFERLGREPYVEAARLCGASRLDVMRRHLLPNASAVAGPLFIQILGLAAAVPGAIGVLGFTNRSDYDLGVLLLRGRENVAAHPLLLVSGLAAFVLIYICLEIVRRGFRSNARPDPEQDAAKLL